MRYNEKCVFSSSFLQGVAGISNISRNPEIFEIILIFFKEIYELCRNSREILKFSGKNLEKMFCEFGIPATPSSNLMKISCLNIFAGSKESYGEPQDLTEALRELLKDKKQIKSESPGSSNKSDDTDDIKKRSKI